MGTRTVWLIFMLCTPLLLGACAGDVETTPSTVESKSTSTTQIAVGTDVAEILEAFNTEVSPSTAINETPAPTETAGHALTGTGAITGRLSYPSEWIPRLYVFAFRVESTEWYMSVTANNDANYVIEGLPAGSYYLVAYRIFGILNVSGAYTQAIACGLNVNCSDHSLIPVEVDEGQIVENINIFDWYGPEDALPPFPAELGSTGSISGTLIYPDNIVPAMMIVAFESSGDAWYFTYTQEGDTEYIIENIPPDWYDVVAYPEGSEYGAGYGYVVECGPGSDCIDRPAFFLVEVIIGGTAKGVNLQIWEAPEGTYPARPGG